MRKFIEIICILAFLFCVGKCLGGCAYHPAPLTWHDGAIRRMCDGQIQIIDATEDLRTSQAIRTAAGLWNKTLDYQLFVRTSRTNQLLIKKARESNFHAAAVFGFRTDHGITGCVRHMHITVDPDYAAEADPVRLTGTVVHELGHALGLGHSPSRDSVMYPSNGARRGAAVRVPGLLEEELNLVRELWRNTLTRKGEVVP